MPRKREYGDDALVSTSVHLRIGTLKTLQELFPYGRSKFIREAVEQALKDHMGLKPIIERLESERDNNLTKAKELDIQIFMLKTEAKALELKSQEEQRRVMITTAIKNVASYTKPEDVLNDLKLELNLQTGKEERMVLATIEEIWRELRAKEKT